MKTNHALLTRGFFAGIIFLFFQQHVCTAQSIMLTNNGASSYKIIASGASSQVYLTAQKLSGFIKQMSGATIPVSNDDIQPQEREILIGNNKHLNALHLNIDVSKIKNNEYVIKTFNNTILLY